MNNTLKRVAALPKDSYVSPYLRQPVRRLEEVIAEVGRAPRSAASPRIRPEPTIVRPGDEG